MIELLLVMNFRSKSQSSLYDKYLAKYYDIYLANSQFLVMQEFLKMIKAYNFVAQIKRKKKDKEKKQKKYKIKC